jgi:hypothetical protein
MLIGNSKLHIQAANDSVFGIYAPVDEGARDFCVASSLPCELAACLLNVSVPTSTPGFQCHCEYHPCKADQHG